MGDNPVGKCYNNQILKRSICFVDSEEGIEGIRQRRLRMGERVSESEGCDEKSTEGREEITSPASLILSASYASDSEP